MTNILAKKYPLIHKFNNYAWDDDEDCSSWERVDKLLLEHSEFLPEGRVYLNSTMHDSWVISYEKTRNDFVITLNDFQSHCFCEAFADLKGTPICHEDVVVPVEMVFTQIRRLAVSHVNRNGKLLPINTDRFLPFFKELLIDHVCMLTPDSIQLGMLFWIERKVKNTRTLILEIEAKHLNFHEHQRASFIQLLGEEYVKWFDLHMEARRKKEWGFDYSSSIQFLKEQGFS